MDIHFIDVGCGNMVLIFLPTGLNYVYDCNITTDNKEKVLAYAKKIIGTKGIDVFINSHRDADHMRGIKELHKAHTIKEIWDTGVPGTSTDTQEYKDYMDLKRNVTSKEIEPRKVWTYGDAKLRVMNAKWDDYTDVNEQSVVLKVEYKENGSSAMLCGDTNYRPWKDKILPYYADEKIKSNILYAAHHGSIDFFNDPSDEKNYYTEHIKIIKPAMTLISVGPNVHELPDKKAVELYTKYSLGSNQGNKVFTTEDKGTMKLELKDDGGWSLSTNQ